MVVVIRVGFLKSKLILRNHVFSVKIPKGTDYICYYEKGKNPMVILKGKNINIFKINDKWFADICGTLMKVDVIGEIPIK